MAIKLSPNQTKDVRNSDGSRIDVNNIFNLERLSSDNSLEGGTSLILGNDFSIIDKKNSREIFEIKLANNLRLEENDDLPGNNQLGSKTSNFFGEISYNPNNVLKTKYNASTKNNLTDINYENFNAELSLNNFVTSFDYLNENSSKNKNSYLTNTTQYNFNDSSSIKFATRENKTTNLTEYYDLIYEYKNDCLAASVEYNKNYYDDRDIKPEENIFLKLTIIPFGETSSPNLRE
jgi:LPS-assembly protein